MTVEQLDLPPIVKDIAHDKTRLVLVVGATGSGKSTTLAAMSRSPEYGWAVHQCGRPIEFVHHRKKSIGDSA